MTKSKHALPPAVAQRKRLRTALTVAAQRNTPGANKDPKITVMRQALTNSTDKYSNGGRIKDKQHAPRPVTLAPVKLPDIEPIEDRPASSPPLRMVKRR